MKHLTLPALLCLAAPAPAQDIADPTLAYNNNCRTCHSLDEGDNRLGPSLHGILGREAGSLDGYGFSDALAGAGFTWDEQSLDAFIADPEAVVPGHAMRPYPGISDPALRQTILDALTAAD